MSAARNLNDYRSHAQAASPRRLQAVRVNPVANAAAKLKSSPLKFVLVVAVAFMAIQLLTQIFQASAVYEKAKLQAEIRELNTTTSILAEEVDSLSSQQNLSDAAQKLGMISNANPVFLSIEQQKVYGKPKAALNSDSGRISRNLIANSALVSKTQVSGSKGILAKTSPVKGNVNQAQPAAAPVGFVEGAIPASPTR